MKTYSGEDFLNELTSEAGLRLPPSPIALRGMVKRPDDAAAQTVPFSPGTSCAMWIDVPVNVIEKVEHLGKVSCRDHEHEYVQMHFKLPDSDEGLLFANLLRNQVMETEASKLLATVATTNTERTETNLATASLAKGCSFLCGGLAPIWYPQYLALLKAAKSAGIIRDFGHCHGFVNDGAPALKAVLESAGEGDIRGEIAAAVVSALSTRCLKCGCDEIFG